MIATFVAVSVLVAAISIPVQFDKRAKIIGFAYIAWGVYVFALCL